MLKVLIVEDEDIIRNGLLCAIDWLGLGCTVIATAENGAIGLTIIQEQRPDIVITDISMPLMTGIEMIEQAQQLYSFKSIFITSYSDFEYAKKAISLKIFEYLLKPIDEAELELTIVKIREVIEKERAVAGVSKKIQNLAEIQLVDLEGYFVSQRSLNYYVKEALNIIKENYAAKISIELIAQQLEVSASYLSRKFKEETAQTFVEILHKYRVQKSIGFLRQGKYRVYEAAELAGFSEYKQFCAIFKKYTGVTPKAFTRNEQLIIKTDR